MIDEAGDATLTIKIDLPVGRTRSRLKEDIEAELRAALRRQACIALEMEWS